MKCGGCENSVRDTVQNMAGVSSVKPSFKASTVEIDYDESQADIESIKQAIQGKGFAVA